MQSRSHRRHSARVIAALIGLGGIAFAEFLSPGSLQNILADIGFVGLVAAAVLLFLSKDRPVLTGTEPTQESQAATWRWTILGLGFAGALVTQTWFQSGTVIAAGDIAPPIGTAWISRIFSNFGGYGNNLGSPTNNQIQLPLAVVHWVTDWLGGSGALAQRIWFTLLVAAIVMAAGALARSLGLSPMAGFVVGVVYYFNPMTLSQIGINDVYLTAMFLIPALAAAVIAYGRSRLQLWQLCLAFVVAAPFVGYTYSNAPLVAMLAFTTGATPLLIWARFGRADAWRSVRGVLIAGALLVGASAYWLIPSWTAIGSIATGNLSALSAWAFTESRSTLTNGFWLNTTWGWAYSQYYPYASDFEHFPLDLVPVLVPLIAFSGLALRRVSSNLGLRSPRMRGLIAIGALGVVLISTGTRPPGNFLFDPLYRLPYGWLLREPGRFLMVVALAYALLSGMLVEQIQKPVTVKLKALRAFFGHWAPRLSSSALVTVALVVVALAASFPLWTGAIVEGPRQGFPSVHVKVPLYWDATANYLNSPSSPGGSLLVLPPDDYYQMPYTWYYGNDGFIVNLLNRHVIVPSGQGYDTVSAELLSAVQLEAAAILDHNWNEASRLLAAIGTPIVLVRGDIEVNFPGRSIVSPVALAAGLAKDPEMKLIYHDGHLSLFALRSLYRQSPTNFATVKTATPDLSELTLVPQRTVLVTSKPRLGHVALFQLPLVGDWKYSKALISTQLTVPVGWSYSLRSVVSSHLEGAKLTLSKSTTSGEQVARVQVPVGNSFISDGNFSTGSWGSVGNCNASQPVSPPQYVRAAIIAHVAPGGASALELAATVGSACESKTLSWHGGPIELRFWERSLAGASPRLCVWEAPINRCAAIPSLPTGSGWHHSTTIVYPDAGTRSITLFFYADAAGNGQPSVEQYADITAKSPLSAPALVLVGNPRTASAPSRVVTFGTGYSPQWVGPPNTTHVIVDGLRNGWITGSTTIRIVPSDSATSHEFLYETLLAAVMAVVAGSLWWVERRHNKNLKTPPHPD